jgi:thymidine phosphorylase
MAAVLLEFVGTAKKGQGMAMATKILNSGQAYKKFVEMVLAQGGKDIDPEALKPCDIRFVYQAPRAGIVQCLDNVSLSRIARMAGAPRDPCTGIFLHHHCGDRVRKGEPIMTIYAASREKLNYALDLLKEIDGVIVQ